MNRVENVAAKVKKIEEKQHSDTEYRFKEIQKTNLEIVSQSSLVFNHEFVFEGSTQET